MAQSWLTLDEVAERTQQTPKRIARKVARGTFPAPTRFRGRGHLTPVWDSGTVNDPESARGRPRKSQKMTREMHVHQLLDEVRWWVWQYGSAAIPQHATGRTDASGKPFPLGSRVSALRTAYKHGRLSSEEQEAFEDLPEWSWDYWDSMWRARFTEVASRFPNQLTKRDRAWLGSQRRRWSKLRPQWRTLFDAYPGMLDAARRSRVHEFVEACEQWLSENPGSTVYAMPYSATVYVDGEKVAVGRRATYYRRRYRGLEGMHKLGREEIRQIETLPGWTWEMSPTHVQAQRQQNGKQRRKAS